MKTFIATLAIMAYIGTLLTFERVNCDDDIKILSSDGSYIPGSVLAWNDKLDKMKPYTDPVGLKFLQLWQNQNYPLDTAFRNGDMKSVIKIAQESIPYAKNLIPHVKDKNLQLYLKNAVIRVEKIVEKLESDGSSNMWTIHSYFQSESKNMGGILGALVGAAVDLAVDLVDDVGGLASDVLHSFL